MDFTVAICTWNRAALLKRTLQAFQKVRLPPGASWELLVVNNRCTDNTDEVLASFEGVLPLRGLFQERQGQSAARNLALAEFKGDRLLWTDDDVEPDPDWILALLDTFNEEQADVVFGPSFPIWVTRRPSWFGRSHGGRRQRRR